jgi:hypothetical protein
MCTKLEIIASVSSLLTSGSWGKILVLDLKLFSHFKTDFKNLIKDE